MRVATACVVVKWRRAMRSEPERNVQETNTTAASVAEQPDALGVVALRGALASLVGGAVLEAVWAATSRALHSPGAPGSPVFAAGAEPCPPEGVAPGVCHPGGAAAWGAVYGALQQRVRAPTLVHGLLLGVLVHAASGAGLGVTRAAPRNGGASRRQVGPVVAHVAYGLATAATFDALS
jgi:hypothetical protein